MKTIATTLPIYDRLSKQAFERGKKGGFDKPVPIMCPRHRLPSFQWNAESDDMGAVTKIELIDNTYDGSEESVVTGWNIGTTTYDIFTVTGLNINSAIEAITSIGYTNTSPLFNTIRGTQIRFIGNLTLNSAPGTEPSIFLAGPSNIEVLSSGNNNIILTAVSDISNALTIYNDTLGGATDFSISDVAITKITGALDITEYFDSLPSQTVLTDVYYSYNGDTLNYLLPAGIYYLRITTENGYVLYSDWFQVDCVYPNLITGFTNQSYETLTTSGTRILSMINSAASGWCLSDSFDVIKGEKIKVVFYLTKTSGTLPNIILANTGWTLEDSATLSEGLNEIELESTWAGDAYLIFENDASNVNMQTSEIWVYREYSEKYLTINFYNSCDIGDILYQDGFTQSLWFESETMEPSFPQEEEGSKNGDGRFIRSFARQVKKYIARTKEMPDFMVEVFNRMKLHDTVELIDLVGNINYLYNLEVDHEWIGDDKYYAKIDLIFDYDESFVVTGCCNNII